MTTPYIYLYIATVCQYPLPMYVQVMLLSWFIVASILFVKLQVKIPELLYNIYLFVATTYMSVAIYVQELIHGLLYHTFIYTLQLYVSTHMRTSYVAIVIYTRHTFKRFTASFSSSMIAVQHSNFCWLLTQFYIRFK